MMFFMSFVHVFQPTLPLRGATGNFTGQVSIHPGSNPRSPCGERLSVESGAITIESFQPTLPLRGATISGTAPSWETHSFNSRSPCGERLARLDPSA